MSAGLSVALVTVSTVTICLAIVRPFLARWQLVDVPNHRSSHIQPTVRGGGVGIAAGLLVGLGCCALLLRESPAQLAGVSAVGVTVAALAVLGFIEDANGLRVSIRLIGQASVVVLPTAAIVLVADAPITLGLVAGLAGVFYINAANFMDGVNGISGLHGAAVGAYFAIVGFASSEPGLMLSAVAVGVAFLSFLPWNAPRARMFMGDVGSYALGGAVWALAMWALVLGVSWLAVVAPLLIYATDVAITLVRRAVRGAPLTEAHHEHVYQRVHELTRSHGKAASLATAGTLACAGIGLWNLFFPGSILWAVAASAVVLAVYLAAPNLLERRRTPNALSDGVLL
ncbi:MAG: glycosyltransferase family 4 protein [Propionibacteriaceae bacterium]|nr:glycosyltransferase family 4 protein [Propionibacteriaceae bacterium]